MTQQFYCILILLWKNIHRQPFHDFSCINLALSWTKLCWAAGLGPDPLGSLELSSTTQTPSSSLGTGKEWQAGRAELSKCSQRQPIFSRATLIKFHSHTRVPQDYQKCTKFVTQVQPVGVIMRRDIQTTDSGRRL